MPTFMIRGFDPGAPGLNLQAEIYLDMPIREIEGIEFYRHSSFAPLELRPIQESLGRACGVVVIWPRQAGESR
jgi:hypothetical protein